MKKEKPLNECPHCGSDAIDLQARTLKREHWYCERCNRGFYRKLSARRTKKGGW